jgi:hypothetical protein
MFHGQPYCKVCGYEGPDFMWMWHHGMGFGVLVQDRETLALRVVEIPDHEVFYRRGGRLENEVNQASEAHVASVVAQELRPTERRVPLAEFIEFVAQRAESGQTELPCPQCRSLLYWRHTGIS